MPGPVSILTVGEMAAADQAAIAAGTPGIDADGARRRRRWRDAVGAALHALPHAGAGRSRQQRRRRLCGRAPPEGAPASRCGWRRWRRRSTDDAKAAAARLGRRDRSRCSGDFGDAELVVVGLFGAGLDRPLGGEALRLARALAAPSATASSPSTCRAGSPATPARPVGRGGLPRRPHRHLPSPQARPRAAAGPRAAAARSWSPTSASATSPTHACSRTRPTSGWPKFPWPKVDRAQARRAAG